jgi:hypothetical protein
MNISQRYKNLLVRRAPIEDRQLRVFSESYETVQGENTKYIIGAIKQVDQKYTLKLIEQGDRVENQLKKRISDIYPEIQFKRQGSVSNLTHIKYFSDVDVLVIIDKFISLENPQIATNPFTGSPENALLDLRKKCFQELSAAFPQVKIDDSGASSISLEKGSLVCKVDVVPSNWLNTNAYVISGNEYDRGIMVLNKDEMKRKINYPFRFNYRLDEKDGECNGAVRMLIRLLKTIKADAQEEGTTIDFSSYDICSCAYRLPSEFLRYNYNEPLSIIHNFLLWMESIKDNVDVRSTLMVVDDSRKIFDDETKKVEFVKLYNDLLSIYNGAIMENQGKLVTEAHLR